MFIFFLMIRRSPNSTRSNTCLPYTPLFRSAYRTASLACVEREACRRPSAHAGVTRVGEQPAHVVPEADIGGRAGAGCLAYGGLIDLQHRSEEHTSELQSLMRISYAVFCMKKTNINI